MARQEKMLAKKRGRPATGRGQTVGVRIHDDQLAQLDAWIARQDEPQPSRPEAIRQLLAGALDASGGQGGADTSRPAKSQRKAASKPARARKVNL